MAAENLTIRNFDALFTSIDGRPIQIKNPLTEQSHFMTLGEQLAEVLTSAFEEKEKVSLKARVRRGRLAEKVITGGDVSLGEDEVETINECIEAFAEATKSTLIAYRLQTLMDTPYFGKDKAAPAQDGASASVTSNNQQGGITAASVVGGQT